MQQILAFLFALFLPFSAFAETSDTHVDLGESAAHIASSVNTVKPGSEFLIGVHIELDPHWHTYTYDPGDAGIPFDASWTLPEGFAISETYWPPHSQFDEVGLATYGFSEEVIFTYKVTAPQTLGDISSIPVNVNYLVCKDICIPQTAEFVLSLPKGEGEASKTAGILGEWHAKSKLASDWGDVKKKPLITETVEKSLAALPEERSLTIYLLFALIGGLILNLMPCVFPVLSLKALAIAKHAEASTKEVRKEGIAYTLGVLSCFWLLAGLLIGLQQAGEVVGWGFQFQSPGFVALMAMLLFFIGLNLSGLFELPVLLGGLAAKIGGETSARNSYLTGLLAALVATPCTAPFMAPAIGFALSQTATTSLLIFTFLGLGLALPFILLSFFPVLLKWLPKPGAWMETMKKFLAFPMYLSALWLLWVLGMQTGSDGIIAVLATAIIVIFLVWANNHCRTKSHFCVIANLFIVAALLMLLTQAVSNMQTKYTAIEHTTEASEVAFSKKKLAELRASNTPVFVDATASWCITCKVNYKVAIGQDSVQQAFKDHGVTYMVADWTSKNAEITNYLASYGYKGVPLYVYYAPGQDGVVLPQLLTPGLVIKAITPKQ